ncbi:MAG TPA: hypothetical protein VHV83_10500, partial [Armatimonadota bacterium]|nr:hypothetical protein [Armatimonadota bacterium]
GEIVTDFFRQFLRDCFQSIWPEITERFSRQRVVDFRQCMQAYMAGKPARADEKRSSEIGHRL